MDGRCAYCERALGYGDGEEYHEPCRAVFVKRLDAYICVKCGEKPGTHDAYCVCDSCHESGAAPRGYPGGA